jgi:hypothetical protein
MEPCQPSRDFVRSLLFYCTVLFAKQPKPPEDAHHINLYFSPTSDTPLAFPSPVMSGFRSCSSNGSIYIHFMTNPPGYSGRALYAGSKQGKLHAISLEQISGLNSIQVISYDAGGNNIDLLLTASAANSGGGEERGRYLAVFDDDRKFRRRVARLQLPIKAVKLASLGDDSLVILGVDVGNAIPRVVLTDDRGEFLNYLDMNGAISRPDQLIHDMPFQGFGADVPLDVKLTTALSAFEMSHSQNSLFLLQSGEDARLIEIAIGGRVTSVHLAMPLRLKADSILSSDHGLIVRAFVDGGDDSPPSGIQPRRWLICERNPYR